MTLFGVTVLAGPSKPGADDQFDPTETTEILCLYKATFVLSVRWGVTYALSSCTIVIYRYIYVVHITDLI